MYFEETMSRDYLQGLVQMKKQADHARHVSEIVKDIMQKIGAVAATPRILPSAMVSASGSSQDAAQFHSM